MAIPVLENHVEYIKSLREGNASQPVIRVIPAAINLTEGHLDALSVQLHHLMRRYEMAGRRPIESDGDVARLVHNQLRLDGRTAAEKRFWALLSAVKAADYVKWRFGTDGKPAGATRYNGSWKDTFRRLWYRAELAKDDRLDDPYFYVDLGGEDFWVGIIEREFSECRTLLHEFLRWWFGDNGECQHSMEEHRRFFIALRLLRPYRAYEILEGAELTQLFEEAEELARANWIANLKG